MAKAKTLTIAADNEKSKCGARCDDGHPCRRDPMPNGKCYRHGGATPSGIASANFKHGKHSEDAHLFHLPKRMAGEYVLGMKNPDSLSMDADIALLFARQCDVLSRVDTGESGEMWSSLLASLKEVTRCRKAVEAALYGQNPVEIKQAGKDLSEVLESIESLAQAGVSDYAAWRKVEDLSERLRKARETEIKRRVQQQEMITQQRLDMTLGKVLLVLRSHILDRKMLGEVSADLRRVVAAAAGE